MGRRAEGREPLLWCQSKQVGATRPRCELAGMSFQEWEEWKEWEEQSSQSGPDARLVGASGEVPSGGGPGWAVALSPSG